MAVPAKCENCANDPQNRPSYPIQPPVNLGVVLGVIGGCVLVALVVAVVVPLVRRRAHRAGPNSSVRRSLYRKVRDGDVERGADADARTNGRGLYLPSRQSSFRHQKVLAGPDAQPLLPLLLDPLRPISALTWSDFHSRRSKSPPHPRTSSSTDGTTDGDSFAMSDEDEFGDGRATDRDRASLSTNRATTSHRSTGSRFARERESAFRRDEQGRADISSSQRARALPLPPRSPTPPALPSKREYSIVSARRASLPLPITPTSPADRASAGMSHLFAPVPVSITSTSSPATVSASVPAAGSALSRHPSSRHRTATLKPGMEPVLEDSAADAYAETRSLQLPSPPASPEQAQPHRSSSSRRRPSLTPSQSAPNTTPYRPRSSTGPAIPLTAAFQTSVLRSGSGSTAGGSTGAVAGHHHRYPSIATSSSARARPSSVQVPPSSFASGALLSPESPDMARPTEAFRRMSTTDIRHRQPSTAEQEDEPRAFLRTSDAARTTHVQPGMSMSYDSRAATMSTGFSVGGGPSFTTPPPHPLSPPALAPTLPRLSLAVHSRAPSAGPSNVTWRGSSSSLPMSPPPQALYPPTPQQQMYQQPTYQQQQQGQQGQGGGPTLVRRKDSNALRPLPVSALMGAPPSAMGIGGGGSRSRSNSVRSTRVGGSGTMQLPPLEPVTPLTMSLRSSLEEEEEREEREERERERERERRR